MKHIYIIGEIDTISEPSTVVKIGIAKDAEARLMQIQTGNSKPYMLLTCSLVHRAEDLEKALHSLLINYRIKGEWFELSSEQLSAVAKIIHSADLDCTCNSCTFKVSRRVMARHRPELLTQYET